MFIGIIVDDAAPAVPAAEGDGVGFDIDLASPRPVREPRNSVVNGLKVDCRSDLAEAIDRQLAARWRTMSRTRQQLHDAGSDTLRKPSCANLVEKVCGDLATMRRRGAGNEYDIVEADGDAVAVLAW